MGGCYIFIEITPRVPSDRSIMNIRYKYIPRNVLGFIATKGVGSNEPGDTYLSCFPGNCYNISI